MTSSNKSSTFPAKRKSDNEETPLKQPHQDTFTSKKQVLEIIKHLHIKCGFLDTEHLFILPSNWLDYRKVLDVNVEIVKNSITPTVRQNHVLLRNISIVGIPKSTVLVIIFGVFMWPLSLINMGPQRIFHLQCFEMVSQKRQYHMLQAICTMEFLRNPLILK